MQGVPNLNIWNRHFDISVTPSRFFLTQILLRGFSPESPSGGYFGGLGQGKGRGMEVSRLEEGGGEVGGMEQG